MPLDVYPGTTSPDDVPEVDRRTAQEASRILARLSGQGAVHVEAVPDGRDGPRQSFVLPAPAVELLVEILVHIGNGVPVTVIPEHAELTTQQAADVLNVSRPWIIKLIESKKLPCRMVGTHRRILFSELRTYEKQIKKEQHDALDELVHEGQLMGDYE